MPRRLLLAALVVACAAPATAANRARVLACKQTCGVAIERCVADGGRARRCKRKILRRCRRAGVVVCAPPDTPGETFHVARSGADADGCGTPETPCRTIQYVLDQLVPIGGAGVIDVAAGVYDDLAPCEIGWVPNRAVVCIANRRITLRGGFVPPDWTTPIDDPGATVLDARAQGRGLRIMRGGPEAAVTSVDVRGFTITNGLAAGGSRGGPDETWASGGGMLGDGSAVTLRDVVFRANRALGGTTSQPDGGRGVGGGLALYNVWPGVDAAATLVDVTFESNEAHGGDGADVGGYALGGALFTYGIPVTGDGLAFLDNMATAGSSDGAGTNGTDKADALGGAVSLEQDSVADLRRVVARGNVATGGDAPNGEAGGGFGGALFAELATVRLSDAVVEGGRAAGGSGQNATAGASMAQGGGVFATMSSLTLDRVRLVGNEARAGDGMVSGGGAVGGGVAVTAAMRDGTALPFAFTNVVLADNRVAVGAGRLVDGGGGGLFMQGASGTLVHATIANNALGDPHLLGAGIAVLALPGWPTVAVVENGIVANHTTPGLNPSCYATAAVWVSQGASADLNRILFAGNVHDTNAGVAGGCNVPSGTVTLSVPIDAADAGFVSAGAPDEDYHLLPSSPAVNQATGSTTEVDLDGTPRPSGAADLGAYETTP